MARSKKKKNKNTTTIRSSENNIKKDIINELHRMARVNFPRRRTVIKGMDDLWQTDLCEFIPYSKINNNFKYALIVIDCFSKFVWGRALKDKKGTTVAQAMREIFKSVMRDKKHKIPTNIQSDNGGEYYSKEFQKLMKEFNINHYSTFSVIKSAFAERVIRSLKLKLYKAMSLRGKYIWYDILDDIITQYNLTKHSVIKMRPADVTNKTPLLKTIYAPRVKIAGLVKFSVGDHVRVSKARTVFKKGYTPNWSAEIFTIAQIKMGNPVTYILKDEEGTLISGMFYEQELQRVKHKDVYLIERVLKRGPVKSYVRYYGLNKNGWVNNTDLDV